MSPSPSTSRLISGDDHPKTPATAASLATDLRHNGHPGAEARRRLDCYDYHGHTAFNWHAPELWRRFTIALRRTLAHQAGLTATESANAAESRS